MDYAVDRRLYSQLAARDPKAVIADSQSITYDRSSCCYFVDAWGAEYRIHAERCLMEAQPDEKMYDFFSIFLINYLLVEQRQKATGTWISEKDLPGGVTFFRGPHQLPAHLIVSSFGNDLHALAVKCGELGGERLALADCSYCFSIVDTVKVALLYWQGDDDFSPEAKLLFDKCLSSFSLDIVFALLWNVCERLGEAVSS